MTLVRMEAHREWILWLSFSSFHPAKTDSLNCHDYPIRMILLAHQWKRGCLVE